MKAQEYFLLLFIFNSKHSKEYTLAIAFEHLGLYGHFSSNLRKLEQSGYITSVFDEGKVYKLRIFSCTEMGAEMVAKINRNIVAEEILKIAPKQLQDFVNFKIFGNVENKGS